MTDSYPAALTVSRKVLRVLIRLNQLMGFLILSLLVASFVSEDFVFRALGAGEASERGSLTTGMRAIMVIGILAVPLAHVVLTRLEAIVDTVRAGDPFLALNAERLQTIAWTMLGLELLHMLVGAIAAAVSSEDRPLDIEWNLSITRWLAVLLCFVLARVFAQGARMRDDLEGTV